MCFQAEPCVDSSAFDSTSSVKSLPQRVKAHTGRTSSTMAPPQAREPRKRKGTPHPKPRKVRRTLLTVAGLSYTRNVHQSAGGLKKNNCNNRHSNSMPDIDMSMKPTSKEKAVQFYGQGLMLGVAAEGAVQWCLFNAFWCDEAHHHHKRRRCFYLVNALCLVWSCGGAVCLLNTF